MEEELEPASKIVHHSHSYLIYDTLAQTVSFVADGSKFLLNTVYRVTETSFNIAKYSTSLTFNIYRNLLVGALSVARNVNTRGSRTENGQELSVQCENGVFLRVLDYYTDASIDLVTHSFTLAELLTLSSFHLAERTVKFSLQTAIMTVDTFDGVFGSTETSRAITAFVQLVKEEFNNEHRKSEDKIQGTDSIFGNIITLGAISKALTAYACLQHMTFKKNQHVLQIFSGIVENEVNGAVKAKEESRENNKPAEVINEFSVDDGRSSMMVKWYREDDQTTTIEMEQHVAEEEEEASCIIEQSRSMRGSMDTLDDLQSFIDETMNEKNISFAKKPQGEDDYNTMLSNFQHKNKKAVIGKSQGFNGLKGLVNKFIKKSSLKSQYKPTDKSSSTNSKISPSKKSLRKTTSTSSFILYNSDNIPEEGDKKGLLMMFDSSSELARNTNGLLKKSFIRLHPFIEPTSNSSSASTTDTNSNKKSIFQVFDPKELRITQDKTIHYPHPSLIANLHRYVKFSTATYGHTFMRLLGIGSIKNVIGSDMNTDQYSFALHTGIPLNNILFTHDDKESLEVNLKPVFHIVSVDHELKVIVVTFRGTLGLSDVLLDLMCNYDDFLVDGKKYSVHSGMFKAAQHLARKDSALFKCLVEAFEKYPGYGLITTGHSLGAGVAALLAMLWSKKNADSPTNFLTNASSPNENSLIHCYAFGVPCICSYEMGLYYQDLVTSVVHRDDLIPCISIGFVRDLKLISMFLLQNDNKGLAEKIIGKTLGLSMLQKKASEEISDNPSYFQSLSSALKENCLKSERLYPPGSVYYISSESTIITRADGKSCLNQKVSLHLCLDVRVSFAEPKFSRTMIMDHSPGSYEESLDALKAAMNGK